MGWDREIDGLWTDRNDAANCLDKNIDDITTEQEKQALLQFIEQGVAILPKALSEQTIDEVLEDINTLPDRATDFFVRQQRQLKHPTATIVNKDKFRLIDFHVNSAAARSVMLSKPVTHFLSLLFKEKPVLFQSLGFVVGSEQRIHQDSAYVVVNQPLKFVGVWIALQDVTAGSGELEYFMGSHRWPHYLFNEGRSKSWLPPRDGMGKNGKYLDWLQAKAKENNIQATPFLAKKGDILVWAADLAHGGSKITTPGLSRFSLVGHYCPESILPSYCNVPHYARVDYQDSAFSSRYYDLRQQPVEGIYTTAVTEDSD